MCAQSGKKKKKSFDLCPERIPIVFSPSRAPYTLVRIRVGLWAENSHRHLQPFVSLTDLECQLMASTVCSVALGEAAHHSS